MSPQEKILIVVGILAIVDIYARLFFWDGQ